MSSSVDDFAVNIPSETSQGREIQERIIGQADRDAIDDFPQIIQLCLLVFDGPGFQLFAFVEAFSESCLLGHGRNLRRQP